jgi:biofilm PGA synthesis N-glycosyltransferase PgaC
VRGIARRLGWARVVVAFIIFAVLLLGTIDAVAAKYFDDDPFDPEPLVFRFGVVTFRVSESFPSLHLLILTGIGFVLVALGSVVLDAITTARSRHPDWWLIRPLLPVPPVTQRAVTPSIRVTALIPAHNEAATLPATLAALGRQSRPPDRVIVVADNCSDDTSAVARAAGAEVFETLGNTDRKAGALNQALANVLPNMDQADVVLVMDADTSLSPDYLRTAVRMFEQYPMLDAIGGLFYGEPGSGLIGQLQRNEYLRYQLQIRQRRGRVFVLTGTASAFRAEALADVAEARGSLLPGRRGDVYDATALTEDNELTIALKSLGSPMVSPEECKVETEVMPTWRALWRQRQRWQRGAIENLAEYGLTTSTVRYWAQQVGIAYGVIALTTAYALLLITALALDSWIWFPFWLVVTSIFVIERVVTVWSGGWRARLVAAPIVLEIIYDFYLQIIFVKCLFDILRGSRTEWGHVERATT